MNLNVLFVLKTYKCVYVFKGSTVQGENEGHLSKISGHDLVPHETRESSFQRSSSIKMVRCKAVYWIL